MRRVILAPDLARNIRRCSVAHAPLETGGVLLGRTMTNGTRIVTGLIAGGPGARATATRFEPDYDWQQRAMEEAFHRNDRVEYLGDWHSHPGGSATPSETDGKALRAIRAETASRCPEPIMIICGGKGRWGIRAFMLDGGGGVRRVPLGKAAKSSRNAAEEAVGVRIRLLLDPAAAYDEDPDEADDQQQCVDGD